MLKFSFKLYVGYIFILFCLKHVNSQTPCNSGMAGIFPCDNYDLMDAFNKATLSNFKGSDIWGWTDSLNNKEYAITTFQDRTCFLDVTDATNPIYLGFLSTNTVANIWRDVKVYNNHAFIVADNVGAHGMQVFDLTRLRNVSNAPENFNADAIYTQDNGGPTVGSCHNIVINDSVGIAYLVGCSSANGGGPIMIDISNPSNPTFVGQYTADGYSHDAQVVTYSGPDTQYQGKQIYIGSHESKVVILDVSNPASPVKISEAFYSNTAYTHQGWFTEAQDFFFINDELDELNFGINTRTVIFNFSDLDNPLFYAFYNHNTLSIDHNLYIKGNLMYQANYRSGLRVFDISDINNIEPVGFFDTYPSNDNTGFNGAWSVYPYFSSENIIISDIERGLIIVKKSNALSIEDNSKNYSYNLFPNPVDSNLNISSNQTINHIKIINLLGQTIIEDKISSKNKNIDVSSLNEGTYIVLINNSVTKKFVKY